MFIASVAEANYECELSTSQRKVTTKIIKKEDTDKRYIHWWPIFFADTKIISKALSKRLKNVFSSLISTQQASYIKSRFIWEGGRLISDIVDICDRNNVGVYFIKMDIEKEFDSHDHNKFILVVKPLSFGLRYYQTIKNHVL